MLHLSEIPRRYGGYYQNGKGDKESGRRTCVRFRSPVSKGDERCVLSLRRPGNHNAFCTEQYDGRVPGFDRRFFGHHHDDRRGDRVDRHAELQCQTQYDRLFQSRQHHPHGEMFGERRSLFPRLLQVVRQRNPDRPFYLAAGLHALRESPRAGSRAAGRG